MKRNKNSLYAVALAVGLIVALPAAVADENVMIVFDGSNSMWGQIDGTAKIEIARDAMDNLLGEWTETHKIGLMAYGHRRRGDCTDIEMLVTPGEDTRAGILERINGITPTGKTPLTGAIEQAATTLSYADAPATVVLISDGLESCDRDPCAVSEALEQAGVAFTAHVVGFDLGDADASALSCIAENTGGQYLSARNADELGDAFSAVSSAVAAAPEPEAEREPEYDVSVSAPDSALAGSAFDVSWTGTVHPRDFVTIVPMGADEGANADYFRVGKGTRRHQEPQGSPCRYGRALRARHATSPARPSMSWTGTVNYRGRHHRPASGTIEVTEGPRSRPQEGRRTVPTIEVSEPDSPARPASMSAGPARCITATLSPSCRWVPTRANADYFRVGKGDGTKASRRRPIPGSTRFATSSMRAGGRWPARLSRSPSPRSRARRPRRDPGGRYHPRGMDRSAVHPRDYVTIVPMGAEESATAGYYVTIVRVGGNTRQL